jgi:prefoldin subunit 5
MARTSQPTDSLELLLETICNTFGAILFIALLVVILLQQAGRTPQTDTSPVQSPAELAWLEHELNTLRDEAQQLRERQQSRQQQLAAVAPLVLQALTTDRSSQRSRRDPLEAERTAVRQAVAAAVELARRKAPLDELDRQRRRTQEQIDKLQQELQRLHASKTREVRTPLVTTESSRREAAIVVQYGRMSLCCRDTARGTEIGPNLDDFLVLDEVAGHLRLTPKPTAGTALNDSPECRAAILRLLRPLLSPRMSITSPSSSAPIPRASSIGCARRSFRGGSSTV